jgi:hypothetical protein
MIQGAFRGNTDFIMLERMPEEDFQEQLRIQI